MARTLTALLLVAALAASQKTSAADHAVTAPSPETYNPSVSFAPLVEALMETVVAIEVESVESTSHGPGSIIADGEGSGFIVSADGLVLTNYHVVERASSITARLSDGTTLPMTRLGGDADMDVALLQLPTNREWDYVDVDNSGKPRVGDWVMAIGNPLGLGHTVTVGVVSGMGRALNQDNPFESDSYIQTDAAINEGNSGGPLFNLDGQVVGINTYIIQGANTVGFAIPMDAVARSLEDLKSGRSIARGYLGVKLAQSEPHKGTGALITEVEDGTPAAAAGLLAADRVVIVGETRIASNSDLYRAVAKRRPGEAVRIQVIRDQVELDIDAVLSEPPDEEANAKQQRR